MNLRRAACLLVSAVALSCGPTATLPDGGTEPEADAGMEDAGLPSKALGERCGAATDCVSGFCADGVCCQRACDGACEACGAGGVCAPVADGTVCRAAAGTCDVAETCSQGVCPADAFKPTSEVCRASAGTCDVAESCDGTHAACPADVFQPTTVSCRASQGTCDAEDFCSGASADCVDQKRAAGVECRASVGECDPAETCTGASNDCPGDGLSSAGTVCRAPAGGCDAAEVCDGTSALCPTDRLVAAATVCRPAAGVCDVAEACTGFTADCPADVLSGSGTTCRAAGGVCDVAETCSGASADCPADARAPAGTACRAQNGVCDVGEACDGVSAACPVDGFAPNTTVCRPAVGACDRPETCTGASGACPGDQLQSSGFVCRPAAGGCDVAEVCTGTTACPADVLVSQGAPSTCAPYVCSGSAAACPTSCTATSQCVAGTMCVDNLCQAVKRVFTTAGLTGNMGGLTGADATCNARAMAANFPGTYKAWLSSATETAAQRLAHFNGPYVLPNGTKVADDWADLTDGTLDNPINYTNAAQILVGAQQAWTATTELGALHPAGNCNGFTSAASNVFARVGRIALSDSQWSTSVTDTCNVGHFIYCFEQ